MDDAYTELVTTVIDETGSFLCSPIYRCSNGPEITQKLATKYHIEPDSRNCCYALSPSLSRDPVLLLICFLIIAAGFVHCSITGNNYRLQLISLSNDPLSNSRVLNYITTFIDQPFAIFYQGEVSVTAINLTDFSRRLITSIDYYRFSEKPSDEYSANMRDVIYHVTNSSSFPLTQNYLFNTTVAYLSITVNKQAGWLATIQVNLYYLPNVVELVENDIGYQLPLTITCWLIAIIILICTLLNGALVKQKS